MVTPVLLLYVSKHFSFETRCATAYFTPFLVTQDDSPHLLYSSNYSCCTNKPALPGRLDLPHLSQNILSTKV